jgi:hypothetical protein
VAVKPEKVLRLLQKLNECPARERPALGAAALRALTGDPALEYCLGLCCEWMCSDQKRFWVLGWLARLFRRCPAIDLRFLRELARVHGFEFFVQMRDIECSSPADTYGRRPRRRSATASPNACARRSGSSAPSSTPARPPSTPPPIAPSAWSAAPRAARVTFDEWAAHPPVFAAAGGLSDFFASAPSARPSSANRRPGSRSTRAARQRRAPA